MPANPVCANCSSEIPPDRWNTPVESICEGCGQRVIARIFPAFSANSEISVPTRLQAEGEASCFYHATNQAVVACDACGRFLCTLCDLDLDGRHLCPACLGRGIHVEKAASLETHKTQYDSLALHLVIWPVLTFWLPIVCAPIALFIVIRHWRTPMSILPRTRIRLWIALLLAVAEIGIFVAVTVFVIWYIPHMPVRGR